jgi:hypothetical protein
MRRSAVALLLVLCVSLPPHVTPGGQVPSQPAAAPAAPELPPSRWELKVGAPPAVAVVLERAMRRRRQEFEAQLGAIERAEKDLAARRSGRVVKDLKAPEGWRAIPRRLVGGGFDYAFKTPQIKGQQVVKAEAVLEQAKRRLAEIRHPEYLPKPLLPLAELEQGAAGTVSFTLVQQVSGTEAVVRVGDEPPATGAGQSGAAKPPTKDVYLSDFPARDYLPGMLVRDWTIEVIGTKTYQGDNGRAKAAPHAKPLEWRKWVEVVRRPEK